MGNIHLNKNNKSLHLFFFLVQTKSVNPSLLSNMTAWSSKIPLISHYPLLHQFRTSALFKESFASQPQPDYKHISQPKLSVTQLLFTSLRYSNWKEWWIDELDEEIVTGYKDSLASAKSSNTVGLPMKFTNLHWKKNRNKKKTEGRSQLLCHEMQDEKDEL